MTTFNSQSSLHRYTATGLVDYNHRSDEQIAFLTERGIIVLPVSEAENLLLVPEVLNEIALLLHFTPEEASEKVNLICKSVIFKAKSARIEVALRKTKRRIDENLKSVAVSSNDPAIFDAEIKQVLTRIDPTVFFQQILGEIDKAIESEDLAFLLREIDDKGLVALAAMHLGFRKKGELEDFLGRVLRSVVGDNLAGIMRANIPNLSPVEVT